MRARRYPKKFSIHFLSEFAIVNCGVLAVICPFASQRMDSCDNPTRDISRHATHMGPSDEPLLVKLKMLIPVSLSYNNN